MANAFSQNGFLPSNITTYFSRPSKITKPIGSRNQSPRNRSGRRMTTHLPTRTRSVVDAQRSQLNPRQSAYSRSRPTSWHAAALLKDYQQFQPIPAYLQPQQYDMYGNTVVTHGLPTPNSFPVMDEAFLDCPNFSLDHMTSQSANVFPDGFQYMGTYSDGSENNPYLFTSGAANMFVQDSSGLATTSWPYLPADPGHNIVTAPVSPAFLPLPDMGDTFNISYNDEVPEKDELVALGLYDSPADAQSDSLLFGGCIPVRRKSLKLEESFEPAPQSDEDENSEGVEQDDGSVVSADFQAENTTIMPPTYAAMHLPDTNQNTEDNNFQSYMVPVGGFQVYPSMESASNHQMPQWY